MKTLLTTTALILSMTAAANAAETPTASTVLGAGPIYTINEYNAFCWYINLGTANITPTSQLMYSSGSTTAISTSSGCSTGSPVGPGKTCAFGPVSPPVSGGLSCEVTFSTSAAHVRGSLELLDISYNELSQVELR